MLSVLLIVLAIVGIIGVYLWTNDIIYYSGKDVDDKDKHSKLLFLY